MEHEFRGPYQGLCSKAKSASPRFALPRGVSNVAARNPHWLTLESRQQIAGPSPVSDLAHGFLSRRPERSLETTHEEARQTPVGRSNVLRRLPALGRRQRKQRAARTHISDTRFSSRERVLRRTGTRWSKAGHASNHQVGVGGGCRGCRGAPCASDRAPQDRDDRALHLAGLARAGASPGPICARAVDARRVSNRARRPWRHCSWPGPFDQLPVAHRVMADSQLKHAHEHQASTA